MIADIDWTHKTHTLSAETIHYCINVHRTPIGSTVLVSDGAGRQAHFELSSRDGRWCVDRVSDIATSSNIAPITIFFGLPKGDKLDRVVRQLSELGIEKLILVRMERNVVVLEGPRLNKRIERLRRIATEAARQSGRSSILEIVAPVDFSEALRFASALDHALFCHPTAEHSMPAMETEQRCGIFVGPEGGFSPAECQQLIDGGIQGVILGQTVLRTETAAIVAATTALARLHYL